MDLKSMLPTGQGTPLNPVSPERANVQKTPMALRSAFYDAPVSPSGTSILSSGNLPDRFVRSHARGGSEVLDKIAKFDGLKGDTNDRRRRDDAAALKRALVGREEAEDEVRLLREESKRHKSELEEERRKTTRVAIRLEDITDKLHATKEEVVELRNELVRTKDVHSHSQNLYEKEARKAKKEAFKYSSAYVKLQEELNACRLSLRVSKSDYESEKKRAEKHSEEAFSAEYKLVGAQEALTVAKEQTKVVEEERDGLKMHLKEEEIARIAAEGRITLPMSKDGDDFGASPIKAAAPLFPESDLNQRTNAADDDGFSALKEELAWEKYRRIEAEEAVEFLKMECQFETCSCRVAERNGSSPYIHDPSAMAIMAPILESMHHLVHSLPEPVSNGPTTQRQLSREMAAVREVIEPTSSLSPLEDHHIAFSESTGTFQIAPTPFQQGRIPSLLQTESAPPSTLHEETSLLSLLSAPILHSASHSHPSPPRSSSPSPLSDTQEYSMHPPQMYHQRSYTTTVPLSGESSAPVFSPSTMTREEALEQIKQRRGRARSMANAAAAMSTPKKQTEGTGRRDISAPAVRSVGRARAGRDMR
ncbi:MAG: hypothetical protein M1814_005284 [Vezdaea aestivalis]|nr:MAG: hypothetical protein M1814_005284 [Vezdaea aestivalis]